MRRFPLLLPLLPLALAACSQSRPASTPVNAFTLCLQNATAGYGNMVALIERVRYDVRSGQTSCKQVNPATSNARLVAHTIGAGGGTNEQLQFATTLPSAGASCYLWRLSTPQNQAGDILQCEGDL